MGITDPQKILMVGISGILMGLTTVIPQAWILAWIAIAPLWLLLVLLNESELQWRKSLVYIGFWGFNFYSLALFWITGIHPLTWMGIPWLISFFIAFFCWLMITGWGTCLALGWGMIFLSLNFLNQHRWQIQLIPIPEQFHPLFKSLKRLVIGMGSWCLLEFIWSQSPLWWTSLALTQSPHNLIILQLGKLSGITTITASILLINGLIAEGFILFFLTPKRKRKLFLKPVSFFTTALVSFIVLHSLGFYLYAIPFSNPDQNPIKVGLIQGNIPPEIKGVTEGFFQAVEGYSTGYKALAQAGVDLVITPETALPFFWQDAPFYTSIKRDILQEKTPILIGSFLQTEEGYTNSLLMIGEEGDILSQYQKIILVPLGEYIPFQSLFGSLFKRLSNLDIILVAGEKKQVLNSFFTPVGKAIIGICYESAFPEHFRPQALAGGEFIMTASNNSFYLKSMLSQHHSQDVLRAIETDRWLARATNTGYSAIINPQGKTVWISDMNTYEIHQDFIYKRQTITPYVQRGDQLKWILGFLTIFSLVLAMDN